MRALRARRGAPRSTSSLRRCRRPRRSGRCPTTRSSRSVAIGCPAAPSSVPRSGASARPPTSTSTRPPRTTRRSVMWPVASSARAAARAAPRRPLPPPRAAPPSPRSCAWRWPCVRWRRPRGRRARRRGRARPSTVAAQRAGRRWVDVGARVLAGAQVQRPSRSRSAWPAPRAARARTRRSAAARACGEAIGEQRRRLRTRRTIENDPKLPR